MRKKRHSGNGRASVDSMTYSSEGSPTSAANHARRTRMHSVSEDCEEDQSSSIPGTILAWLNDDSGSSDGESKGKGTTREEQPVDKRKAAMAAMSSLEERPRHSERKTVEVAARAAARAAAMTSKSSGICADFSRSMSNSSVTLLTRRLSSARVGVHEKRPLTSARQHKVGEAATSDAVEQGASTGSAVSTDSTADQAGGIQDESNAKTNHGSSPEEEMQRWLSEREQSFDASATGGIPGSGGGCSEEQGEHQGCLDLGERREEDCALLGVSRKRTAANEDAELDLEGTGTLTIDELSEIQPSPIGNRRTSDVRAPRLNLDAINKIAIGKRHGHRSPSAWRVVDRTQTTSKQVPSPAQVDMNVDDDDDKFDDMFDDKFDDDDDTFGNEGRRLAPPPSRHRSRSWRRRGRGPSAREGAARGVEADDEADRLDVPRLDIAVGGALSGGFALRSLGQSPLPPETLADNGMESSSGADQLFRSVLGDHPDVDITDAYTSCSSRASSKGRTVIGGTRCHGGGGDGGATPTSFPRSTSASPHRSVSTSPQRSISTSPHRSISTSPHLAPSRLRQVCQRKSLSPAADRSPSGVSSVSPRLSPVGRRHRSRSRFQAVVTPRSMATVAGGVGGPQEDELQVEIAPPLLGKFKSLLLDNCDLEGLARCIPQSMDAGRGAPTVPETSEVPAPVPTPIPEPVPIPVQIPVQVPVPRSETAAARRASRKTTAAFLASISVAGVPGDGGNSLLDSPSGHSGETFTSDSITTMAEEEVNDFLLESTDESSPGRKRSRSNVGSRSSGQHSLDGEGSGETGGESSRSGGGQSGFGVCSKDEMEDFFRSSSSSSSSDDSGGNLYEGGRDKCGGVLLGGGSMEQSRVLVERQEERRHRRLSKRTPRRRNEPLSPLRSLSKEDRRFMKDNTILSEGLSAVVGLNFSDMPVARQLEMMKQMTITRYSKYGGTYRPTYKLLPLAFSTCGDYSATVHDLLKDLGRLKAEKDDEYLTAEEAGKLGIQGEVIALEGEECSRFHVVLGAPRELLAVGEVAAVEVKTMALSSPSALGGGEELASPTKRDYRLLAGQYFGERGLFRDMERRMESVVAASSVVYCASVDIGKMELWEPFRMFLLMKEVPLLAKLPMHALQALQRTLRHEVFASDEYIVRQGDAGEVFYMIVRGTVDVLEESRDPMTGEERERLLVQMFEGHYFGELALIYGEPRNASVRARGDVRCVSITKEDFRSCMNEKKFQEVLEEVAYQRAAYREQRALNTNEKRSRKQRRRLMRMGSAAGSTKTDGGLGGSMMGGGDGAERESLRCSTLGLHRQSFRETAKVVKRKLQNGTRIINKYQIISELGKGSYGTVHLCKDEETGQQYAMKVMDKRRRGQRAGQHLAETLRREVAVMKKLRHPNIVTLREVIDDPKAQQIYMIQEYMEGGPLLPEGYQVQPLSSEEAREKFVDCLRGLHYLHQHGVVHGDIKPQNLLMSKTGTIKIADFGAAVMLQHESGAESPTKKGALIGTPAFTSPELFGSVGKVSPASDVWAMGVSLYQMVYGILPFWPPSGNHHELEVMIKHRELSFPVTGDAVLSPVGRANSVMSASSKSGGTRGGCTGSCGGSVGGQGRARAFGGTPMDYDGGSLSEGQQSGWISGAGGDSGPGSRVGCGGGSMAALEAHDPMSGYLRNLLRRLLDKDPDHRIDLSGAIQHPWVTREGSMPLDDLDAQDDSWGNETELMVEVTDGELQEAWTIYPMTPDRICRSREHSPSSRSSTGSRASWRCWCRNPPRTFFPLNDHPALQDPFRACQIRPERLSSPSVLGDYLDSPQTPWSCLTPTIVGNLARFRSFRIKRSASLCSASTLESPANQVDALTSAKLTRHHSTGGGGGMTCHSQSMALTPRQGWRELAKAPSHLKIAVDQNASLCREGGGALVSPGASSTPGVATSDGAFFCGPEGALLSLGGGVSPMACYEESPEVMEATMSSPAFFGPGTSPRGDHCMGEDSRRLHYAHYPHYMGHGYQQHPQARSVVSKLGNSPVRRLQSRAMSYPRVSRDIMESDPQKEACADVFSLQAAEITEIHIRRPPGQRGAPDSPTDSIRGSGPIVRVGSRKDVCSAGESRGTPGEDGTGEGEAVRVRGRPGGIPRRIQAERAAGRGGRLVQNKSRTPPRHPNRQSPFRNSRQDLERVRSMGSIPSRSRWVVVRSVTGDHEA